MERFVSRLFHKNKGGTKIIFGRTGDMLRLASMQRCGLGALPNNLTCGPMSEVMFQNCPQRVAPKNSYFAFAGNGISGNLTEVLKRIADGIRRHGVVEASVRFLDHLLNPRGMSPMGLLGWNVLDGPAGAAEEHFEKIAEQSAWGSQESISGPGSELGYTEGYRLALADLLTRRGIASIFDAPCGDLNWIGLMLNQVSVRYIGADISDTVVKTALNRHPDKTVIKLDITSDIFPSAQLWHCRDCMFHLSYLDIRKSIENFLRSDCEYALLTSHKGLIRNFDIRTGGWRYLDLRRAPFNLPAPIEELRDYRLGIDHPRYVGLWSQKQLARALAS